MERIPKKKVVYKGGFGKSLISEISQVAKYHTFNQDGMLNLSMVVLIFLEGEELGPIVGASKHDGNGIPQAK